MYSTDLEETQWQVIKKILNLQERKRKYALREIWNAIFYIVKTGCQWRMLLQTLLLGSWFTTIIANGLLWVNLICY